MGHRALVAYERPDETYNLHYSHWGGCNLRLKHKITESTPFGGDEQHHPWTTEVFEHFQTETSTDLPKNLNATRPSTEVEPEPLATKCTFEEIIEDELDYHMHEAFFVVSQSFDVTAYRTLWPGFSVAAETVEDSPSVGHGLLMTVWWYEGEPIGDGHLRGWFSGAKTMLGEFVDRGVFTDAQATTYLLDATLSKYRSSSEYHIKRRDE